MAKKIVVDFGGAESGFSYSKVDRNKLYARRRRIMLDHEDKPCVRAELSIDGATLIRSGMTAQGYFTAELRWVPNAELVGLDADGAPLDKQPSTLDVAQPLEEVSAAELMDVAAQSVYALDPDNLDPKLEAAADAGTLFRFDFNTRADYRMERGYLVKNEHGWFAIIGHAATPEWNELDKPAVELFVEEEDDDLDFEMF